MEKDTMSRAATKHLMNLKRHTLVDVSDAGREYILAELAGNGTDSSILREKFGSILLPQWAGVRIPGIVRREEVSLRSGFVPVGFCEPISSGEGRLRIAAFARMEDVIRVISPYALVSMPIPLRTASTAALAASRPHAKALGLVLGVWGSAALEIYTGLPCTHEGSDLDLLVRAASLKRLSSFLDEITLVEQRFALRIDVEVELSNGYGVQLKELIGQGHTVLGKSINGVELLSREQILAELPHDSSAGLKTFMEKYTPLAKI
jgi:phosphoribosyl-dephospho-CoA transferase